jgi:urea transporter
MFQESALTGAFFLLGIALSDLTLGIGALAGAIPGMFTAWLLRFDRKEIAAGLYGYNGSLVGIGVLFYLEPGLASGALLVVGAGLSSVVTWGMRRYFPLPTYTMPFILVTWLALGVASALELSRGTPPSLPTSASLFSAVIQGLSEVMFQATDRAGICFLVGILLCSRKGAFWALAGSLIGLLTAWGLHKPDAEVAAGLFGYNAALAAMALALWSRSWLLPVLAAVVSVPLTSLVPELGVATLTAPFVFASWLVILVAQAGRRIFSGHARPGTKTG